MTETKTPVCSHCDDTHWVEVEDNGPQMCQRCPLPCEKCRYGAYCETTPCPCSCHKHVSAEESRENPLYERMRTRYAEMERDLADAKKVLRKLGKCKQCFGSGKEKITIGYDYLNERITQITQCCICHGTGIRPEVIEVLNKKSAGNHSAACGAHDGRKCGCELSARRWMVYIRSQDKPCGESTYHSSRDEAYAYLGTHGSLWSSVFIGEIVPGEDKENEKP
jgi:hypothetical protein